MERTISTLYHVFVSQNCDELRRHPDYQYAMSEFARKKDGSDIAKEDGAALREHVWGQISFAAGLHLGLALVQELSSRLPGGE